VLFLNHVEFSHDSGYRYMSWAEMFEFKVFVHPKLKFCHYVLMAFQTYLTLFFFSVEIEKEKFRRMFML